MQDAQGLLQTAIADNRTQMLSMGQVASGIGPEADPGAIIESLVLELQIRIQSVATGKEFR